MAALEAAGGTQAAQADGQAVHREVHGAAGDFPAAEVILAAAEQAGAGKKVTGNRLKVASNRFNKFQ